MQQGGELAYLIRHDPEFRGARREDLEEAGRRVRLKSGIPQLVNFLNRGYEDARFSFFVVSAAPRVVVESALAGVVAPENIFGTELDFDPQTGEVRAVRRVPAGYGKVAVIDALRRRLGIASDRVIYVGDGSSDVHVMLHVNNGDGFTISVSENQQLARIAKRTVLSESAFSILLPVLTRFSMLTPPELRDLFEANGFRVSDWERERTDRLTVNVINPRARDAAHAEALRAEVELSLGATPMTPQTIPVSA
ncbi:MAG: HAD family hydrolase [Gemmatimonadaceae bacterium]